MPLWHEHGRHRSAHTCATPPALHVPPPTFGRAHNGARASQGGGGGPKTKCRLAVIVKSLSVFVISLVILWSLFSTRKVYCCILTFAKKSPFPQHCYDFVLFSPNSFGHVFSSSFSLFWALFGSILGNITFPVFSLSFWHYCAPFRSDHSTLAQLHCRPTMYFTSVCLALSSGHSS